MGVMVYNKNVVAATVVEHIFKDKPESLVKVPSAVQFIVGGGGAGVYLTILIGNEVVMDAQEINDVTTWPIAPDQVLLVAPALPLDTINVRIHNRNAADRVVRILASVEPIG